MSKRFSTRDEKALAERLRQEAARWRPAFSEALHDRIWRAIEQCKPDQAASTRQGGAHHRVVRRAAAALAAAGLVLVALLLEMAGLRSQSGSTPDSGPLADRQQAPADWTAAAFEASFDELPALAALDRDVSAKIPSVLDNAIAPSRWAYLDHDARLAMELLAERFPFDVVSIWRSSQSAERP